MRLAPGVWATPNHNTDPVLRATLAQLAERVEIKQFDHAPLAYAIRTRLPEALQSQRFSADAIAAELGLSRRTLHRHLAAENITFQELLDLHRQEQAVQMLQSGAYAMSEIAYALGYSEQSSFNRAFRRWTGTSPSAWQRPPAGGSGGT
jgi:AraC-like DNA-binding protein